jgi:hypothetical protein
MSSKRDFHSRPKLKDMAELQSVEEPFVNDFGVRVDMSEVVFGVVSGSYDSALQHHVALDVAETIAEYVSTADFKCYTSDMAELPAGAWVMLQADSERGRVLFSAPLADVLQSVIQEIEDAARYDDEQNHENIEEYRKRMIAAREVMLAVAGGAEKALERIDKIPAEFAAKAAAREAQEEAMRKGPEALQAMVKAGLLEDRTPKKKAKAKKGK